MRCLAQSQPAEGEQADKAVAAVQLGIKPTQPLVDQELMVRQHLVRCREIQTPVRLMEGQAQAKGQAAHQPMGVRAATAERVGLVRQRHLRTTTSSR